MEPGSNDPQPVMCKNCGASLAGRGGSLEFIVNGATYASVAEIPDVNVKNAIQQAVAEWQKQN